VPSVVVIVVMLAAPFAVDGLKGEFAVRTPSATSAGLTGPRRRGGQQLSRQAGAGAIGCSNDEYSLK